MIRVPDGEYVGKNENVSLIVLCVSAVRCVPSDRMVKMSARKSVLFVPRCVVKTIVEPSGEKSFSSTLSLYDVIRCRPLPSGRTRKSALIGAWLPGSDT